MIWTPYLCVYEDVHFYGLNDASIVQSYKKYTKNYDYIILQPTLAHPLCSHTSTPFLNQLRFECIAYSMFKTEAKWVECFVIIYNNAKVLIDCIQ